MPIQNRSVRIIYRNKISLNIMKIISLYLTWWLQFSEIFDKN